MSSARGKDFCVYLSQKDITNLFSSDRQREAYREYREAEAELADVVYPIDMTAAAERAFKACDSIQKGGFFSGEGLPLPRMFAYRKLFLTVNYNLSEKYQNQMELEILLYDLEMLLYDPVVEAIGNRLMSQKPVCLRKTG